MHRLAHLWNPLYEGDNGGGSGGEGDNPPKNDPPKETAEQKALREANERAEAAEAEKNRLAREASERARKDREAEQQKQKDEGKHEERANAAEKRVEELEAENASLKSDIETDKKNREIEAAATAAGMEHPGDALLYLTEKERKSQTAIEGGLRRIKEERPKLFGEVKQSSADHEDPDETRQAETTLPAGVNRQTTGPGGSMAGAGIGTLRGVKRKS